MAEPMSSERWSAFQEADRWWQTLDPALKADDFPESHENQRHELVEEVAWLKAKLLRVCPPQPTQAELDERTRRNWLRDSGKMPCDNHPLQRATHYSGSESHCCACHIASGGAPADWHPACMA